MSRPLTPEQLAKREALKNRTTEEVYQDAVKRGLESNVSAERVAAIKAYADERNPGIIEMKDKVKIAEDRAAKAEAALSAITAERDTLLARVNELQPLADRVPAVEAEYAELKANFDSKIVEARTELVAEAQQERWAAARARNDAEEKLREAGHKINSSGWTQLRATLADLLAKHSVPMPSFWETSANMPSAFWTLWGWSETQAKVFTACKISYPQPTPAFKAQLLGYLKRTLPLQMYPGMEPPHPVSDLSERIAAMTEQAKHWNVWEDIEREFEQAQVERNVEHLRVHNAHIAAIENEDARRGVGRTPIVSEQPVSVTGYTGPHDPDCCCGRPGCNPLPAHLRADVWLGNPPSEAKVEDINARHEINTLLDYGQQLIEREAAAKKGKIINVPPPSGTLGTDYSLDNEEELLP